MLFLVVKIKIDNLPFFKLNSKYKKSITLLPYQTANYI